MEGGSSASPLQDLVVTDVMEYESQDHHPGLQQDGINMCDISKPLNSEQVQSDTHATADGCTISSSEALCDGDIQSDAPLDATADGCTISSSEAPCDGGIQSDAPLDATADGCTTSSSEAPCDGGIQSDAPLDATADGCTTSSSEALCDGDVLSELEEKIQHTDIQYDTCVHVTAQNDVSAESVQIETDEILHVLPDAQDISVQVCESVNNGTSTTEELPQPPDDPMDSTEIPFELGDELVLLTGSWNEFTGDNYLRGCKWSPDGSCLLACSEDNNMRLYNLPRELYSGLKEQSSEMVPVLKMHQADSVYDFCWYPKMSSWDPNTCCFITSSKDQPIHMWDAFYGHRRASYVPYNHLDEVISPNSLAFSGDGEKVYAGFNKSVKVFQTSRPGRTCTSKITYDKKNGGQSGIISCISMHPCKRGTFALGSYSCSVALYTDNTRYPVMMFTGLDSGATHIQFTHSGDKILVGLRKNNSICCWDLRNPMKELAIFEREVTTNQRVYFDQYSNGHWLLSGGTDGCVYGWNLQQLHDGPVVPHCLKFPAHRDAVNGCSVHPTLPLLATCSGQRSFTVYSDPDSDLDSEECYTIQTKHDNSIRIWTLK